MDFGPFRTKVPKLIQFPRSACLADNDRRPRRSLGADFENKSPSANQREHRPAPSETLPGSFGHTFRRSVLMHGRSADTFRWSGLICGPSVLKLSSSGGIVERSVLRLAASVLKPGSSGGERRESELKPQSSAGTEMSFLHTNFALEGIVNQTAVNRLISIHL